MKKWTKSEKKYDTVRERMKMITYKEDKFMKFCKRDKLVIEIFILSNIKKWFLWFTDKIYVEKNSNIHISIEINNSWIWNIYNIRDLLEEYNIDENIRVE